MCRNVLSWCATPGSSHAIRLLKVKNTQRNSHTLITTYYDYARDRSPRLLYISIKCISFLFSPWAAKAESFIIYDADFGLRFHNNKYPHSHRRRSCHIIPYGSTWVRCGTQTSRTISNCGIAIKRAATRKRKKEERANDAISLQSGELACAIHAFGPMVYIRVTSPYNGIGKHCHVVSTIVVQRKKEIFSFLRLRLLLFAAYINCHYNNNCSYTVDPSVHAMSLCVQCIAETYGCLLFEWFCCRRGYGCRCDSTIPPRPGTDSVHHNSGRLQWGNWGAGNSVTNCTFVRERGMGLEAAMPKGSFWNSNPK